MKNLFFYCLLFLTAGISSCDNDDDNDPIVYDYHAHIIQPSAADKEIDDVLFIEVEFESHTGQNVEHIEIEIRNKATSAVVYKKPDNPHIEGDQDNLLFQDQFVLSAGNGITTGDYILKARVWGADGSTDEVTEVVEFHVHP